MLLFHGCRVLSLAYTECSVVGSTGVAPGCDQDEGDVPEEHSREIDELIEDKNFIDGSERVVEIVDITQLNTSEVEPIWMRLRPILCKPVRVVPSIVRDKEQHLFAELPALNMEILSIPEILSDPFLIR